MGEPQNTRKLAPDEANRRIVRGSRDYSSPVRLDPDFDSQSNIVVSAGAGSGKTTVLIERMVALIRSGVEAQSIVAITFTKKAAGELQERFFKGLLDAEATLIELISAVSGENHQDWASELQHVRTALIHSEDAYIGTIHAFCLRLLKQRSLQAGLPPDFSQVDEAQELKMRRSFWHSRLAAARNENDADLAQLSRAQVSVSGTFNMFGTLCQHNSVDFVESGVERPDLQALFDSFDASMERLLPNLPISDNPDEFLLAFHRSILMLEEARGGDVFQKAHAISLALSAFKPDRAFAIVMTRWGSNGSEPKKFSKLLKEGGDDLGCAEPDTRSLLDFFAEDVYPTMQKWNFWLHDVALRFAKQSVESYRIHRLESGLLTYDDLLSEARRLVVTSESARQYFQSRYTHILVDEFQDTDPEQAALLFGLCSSKPNQKDWIASQLFAGRLFVVGDDKQSIYRFRKADFQAFSTVREAIIREGGYPIELTANFRSDKRICAWVNESVGGLLSQGVAPYQADWVDIEAAKGTIGPDDAIVRFSVAKGSGRGEAAAARAEARAIAAWIHSLVNPDREDAPGFGDFKILVRGHSKIPIFLAELSAAGVPVGVSGGKADNAPRSLPLVHDFLKCLLDPNDGVALVSTLRGLLFGVSDVDLLAYREAGGDWKELLADADQLESAPDSIRAAQAALQSYAELFRTSPPAAAFEQFLKTSGLQGALRLIEDSDIEGGMLERIAVMLVSMETAGHSFAECVAEIGRYRGKELKLEPFSEKAPFGSCTQIMTVHQSKGLQADYVFLADSSPVRKRKSEIHIWREGSSMYGRVPFTTGSGHFKRVEMEPYGWTQAVEEEQKFEEAERIRLLYVAATRACKQLIISTQADPRSGTWDVLADALIGENIPVIDIDPDESGSVTEFEEELLEGPSGASEFDGEAFTARLEQLSRATWSVRRPSEKEVRPGLFEEDRETQSAYGRAAASGSGSSDGMNYGSAIHTLFESLVARRKETVTEEIIQNLASEVMASRFEEAKIEEQVERSVKEAHVFVESELWASLRTASRVLTEVPFTTSQTYKDSQSSEGVDIVTSGVVDLAFRTEDGWTIVDYKSDNAGKDVLLERHASQIEAYLRAWYSIFPGESISGLIWSTDSGTAIPIKFEART